MVSIENYAWVLPRPGSTYIGSFPLHFEKKLLELLNINSETDKILHPFGGKAKYGIRCDLSIDVKPDYICDAHSLPFDDNEFDLVVLDPPYSEDYSEKMYATNFIKLNFKKYTSEAVRVCKDGGYIVMYHYLATPSMPDTVLIKRIFMETRIWHKLRCVHVYQKRPGAYKKKYKSLW